MAELDSHLLPAVVFKNLAHHQFDQRTSDAVLFVVTIAAAISSARSSRFAGE